VGRGVDADVVDQHRLGVGGGGVGRARPVAADGYVEEQEVGVIKDPGAGGFGRCCGCRRAWQKDWGLRREGGELGLVDVEANFGGFPFDGVDVEGFGKVFAAGEFSGGGEIGRGTVGERAVDRTVNGGGLFADIFHDVDLAALGPADRVDVVAEHPKGGPDTLAFWNFYPGFEAAEGLSEQALCLQTRGRVFAGDAVAAFKIFFASGDNEVAVLDAGVLPAIRVGLEFVIAPTVAAEVVGPFFRVGSGTVGGVEFVGPDEGEIFRGGG
jgi:hypothetical protein